MKFDTRFDPGTRLECEFPDSDGDVPLTLSTREGVFHDAEHGEHITAYLNREERIRLIEHLIRYTPDE